MARRVFLKALKKVEENKKSYEEKAQETRKCQARLPEMQLYVDLSVEKRALLMDLILNGKSSDSDESLLNKGVIVYVNLLEVVKQIAKDLEKADIDYYVIEGKTNQKSRGKIASEFKSNPNSKVIIITNAASESLNLNTTNEMILYDLPKGPGAYTQVLGRVARNFSNFERQGRSFYIHYIIVDDTLDEYKPILLSSKKELEEQILRSDTIPLKEQGSFDNIILKKLRQKLLWKRKHK